MAVTMLIGREAAGDRPFQRTARSDGFLEKTVGATQAVRGGLIIDGARALQRVRENYCAGALLSSQIAATTRQADRLHHENGPFNEADTQMDKSMIKGIALGGIAMVVLGAGAVTSYKSMMKPEFAEVIAVKEVSETVVTPHERCEDAQVQHQAPVKDEHRVAGTIVGGLAGGLLGSTVGGGKGKTLATVAGAAAGGFAGNQVQKNMQEKDVVTTTERRCKTVSERSHKVVGYDVTYHLDGKDGVVRTSFKPGPKLPVKDGQVVTTQASDNKTQPAS